MDVNFSKSSPPTLFFHVDLKVNDVVPWVLDLILNKHIISPNPHVRQAACIWLLSLVKKLSTHKAIKVRNMPFPNTSSLSLFLLLTLFLSFPSPSLLLPLFSPCGTISTEGFLSHGLYFVSRGTDYLVDEQGCLSPS